MIQHFLLVLQKKMLAKEKEPGGISDFPPDPLETTKKTASVFLEFSRAGRKTDAKTYNPTNFERKANSLHLLKRNCFHI